MGIKIGPIEIDTDFSDSSTSTATSSSDEEKKINKKAAKGKDKKYKPDPVGAYEPLIGRPKYKTKGAERSKTKFQPPPAPDGDKKQAETPASIKSDIGKIDEAKVRDALLQFVSENCCYGSKAAKNMDIKDIRLNSAYHYTLESFTETRKVKWKSEGYPKGKTFDPAKAGDAPLPWEIPKTAKKLFKDEKDKSTVPKTASVKKCWYCKAKGKVKCGKCKGQAYFTCDSCNGSGENGVDEEGNPSSCWHCHGSGQTACPKCHGAGKYTCKTCQGHKKLLWFIRLNIKWENKEADFIEERTALPDELVANVKGETVYEDTQFRVLPITEFPVESVIHESKKLIEKEAQAHADKAVLMQRQRVKVVPVSEIDWEYSGEKGTFFVYGLNNKVWFPEYPQKCCCAIV